MQDPLVIAGEELSSRLIMGTGGARSLDALEQALIATGAEIATVALRRVDVSARGSVIDVLKRVGCRLLPNTAGCYTAADAITTARLARDAFETNWIKLEVIGDDRTLLPDPIGLLEGAEQLVDDGSWSSRTRTTIRSLRLGWRASAVLPLCPWDRRSAVGWGSATRTTSV